MKKIAIIGANEFQNPLILKVKEMGYEAHVFAWQSGDIGERTADHFYPISITEKEQILAKCREIGVCAVASIGSDLAVHAVNHVARGMGFPCNSERCERVCTDKFEMRKAFDAAGIETPRFLLADKSFSPSALRDFTFPLIVKPTDRSGSRGIQKVFSLDEVLPAVRAACEVSFNKQAIVEEFIEGNEYSCETISFNGVHHVLTVTKKFTTGAPHFIETGHQEPSDLSPEILAQAESSVCRALDALDIRYGASHPEFRVTADGKIRFIEVGARMGGDCIGSDLVQISTGKDFVRMVVDVACGIEPDLRVVSTPCKAEVQFIFTKADLEKLRRIEKTEPESIWRVSEILPIQEGAVTDSSTRFGYYITKKPF